MEIATFGGVVVICKSILSAANTVQDLADNWFNVTEEYESKVDALQQKLDFYGEQMSTHGVKVNNRMVKTLQRAQTLLEAEEKRVMQLDENIQSGQYCGVAWWLYAKITMIGFPEKLEKTIKRVTDEIDKITADLKMEAEMSAHVRNLGEHKAIDTTILDNDHLYVPIEGTQKEVIAAIEDSTSPSIVLLHGGVGKGKSTLARKMCEYYGKYGPKADMFQHVILISCGNIVVTNPSTKQFEILQLLSPNSLYSTFKTTEENLSPLVSKSGEDTQQGKVHQEKETNSTVRITEALKNFLTGKRILIILDDVSDRDFLMKMWKATPGAKRSNPSDERRNYEIWLAAQGEKFVDHSHQEVFSKIFHQLCEVNVADFKAFEKMCKTVLDHDGITVDISDDQKIFQSIWEVTQGGQHIKYLVTSQRSDLCSSLIDHSQVIGMRDPNQAEAMEILASLVGWKDRIIPENLQGIVLAMIESLDGNPLALACLASNISYPNDDWAWNEAFEDLHTNLLENRNTKTVLGEDYATPPMAALRLSIDSLKIVDAKMILFLVYACKEESVPEEVLRILYSAAKSSNLVAKSLAELKSRELLKPNPSTLAPTLKSKNKQSESRAWSLRSLVKLCMAKDMAESEDSNLTPSALNWKKVRSDVLCLIGADETEEQSNEVAYDRKRVAITLCALYFDPTHADQLVKKLATQATLTDSSEGIYDLRRSAIEPIIWLLAQPKNYDNTWTEEHIHCARQVFLQYICEQKLDDDRICMLLKMTSYDSAPLATLAAIADIFAIEEAALLNQGDLKFLEVLVHLLESSISSDFRQRKGKDISGFSEAENLGLREAASKAIAFVSLKACKENVALKVAETPGILTVLVRSIQLTLAQPPGVSDNLGEDPAAYAASALGLLAIGGDSIRSQILNDETALATLLESLSRDDYPKLQRDAAETFLFLGSGEDPIKSKMVENHDILEGLIKSISQIHNSDLQVSAISCLRFLAAGQDSIKSKIFQQDGALAAIVRSLSQENNQFLQVQAVLALGELAGRKESTKLKILEEDGVLVGLVKSLSQDNNHSLQATTAWALARLAEGQGQDSVKSKIFQQDGALAALVKSLSQDNNQNLQVNAMYALGELAGGEESIKSRILEEDGALLGLVKSLSEENNPQLQESAGWALAQLAMGQEPIKSKILQQDGALPTLVKLLSQESDPFVQQNGSWALMWLADAEESIKSKIVEEDGALPGLFKILSLHNQPDLQENAAWALWTLAERDDALRSKILDEDGVFARWVKALSEDDDLPLKRYVARALKSFTRTGEWSLKVKMTKEEGLMTILTKLAANEDDPVLQEAAIESLKNLEGVSEPPEDIAEHDTPGSSRQVGGVQLISGEPNGLGGGLESTSSDQ